VNRGCGSQLLSGCAPPPYDWFNADHDQRWDGSLGKEFQFGRNRWLTVTSEYGSGLSTGAACDRCKVPAHLTFDAQLGQPLGQQGVLILAARNVFNDRYAVTINSSLQGTHYAQPRSLDVTYRLSY
jgi:outer membrane receptor for Fe3+-dicitrate